jgi:hypothetical protein
MSFLRLAILSAFFASSIARAACDDFEIFANKVSLGCDDFVYYEIIYGDYLKFSVSPAKGTYEWISSYTKIKTGYSFSPEFSENPSTSITEIYQVRKDGLTKTIEVTVLSRPSYTVFFDTDEDDEFTTIPPQTVLKNELAEEPEETETLTKTGYLFDRWDFDFNTPIVEDTTIKAIWRVETYIVYFNTDGGEPSNIRPQVMLNKGELAKKPTETLTKTGYDFDGWNFDFSTPIVKDTTIKAKWKIKKYTVSFNSNGGSAVPSQSVNYNSKASMPESEPTKTGYDFDGWDFDFNTPITKNITIKAKWKEINTPEEAIVFEDPGFDFDPALSNKQRHYFVANSSLCKKMKKTTIYIGVKPDIILRIGKSPQKSTDEDGLLYEILFTFNDTLPGLDTLVYELISKDGSRSEFHTILAETPIPFEDLVRQKWNNLLFVNNNPKENGGYEFTDFKWFRNNDENSISDLQFYPVKPGLATLNPKDTLRVVMQTAEGIRVSTCEGHAKDNAKNTDLAKAPKKRSKQVLGTKEKTLNYSSKIYNLGGKLTKETPAGVYIVEE